MHQRETHKTTSTGPLALAALGNSELAVHGLPETPLDLTHLHQQGRRVLVLFPAERARLLTPDLRRQDPRPVTLVVPDGTWGQAARIPKRVTGLQHAEPVVLPEGEPSTWRVRNEPRIECLSTFEAIARAFGVLEGEGVQRALEELFGRFVEGTLAARGNPAAPTLEATRADAQALDILYRDDHLVAINKPSGMLVHRGWARDDLPALQRLRNQLGRPVYPVHRLDRATSGVLLFALHAEVARNLHEQFAAGTVHKRYLALCRGSSPSLGRIDHPLTKTTARGRTLDGPVQPAVTDVRLLGAFERYGLYEAVPHTGRTHQIRRHLKHASHPIIGDIRYGKGEHNRLFRERFAFHRLALHCHRVAFEHPRGGGRRLIEAPPTPELAELLGRLGLSTHILS